MKIFNLFKKLIFKKNINVYGLIGMAGTGKSHRAKYICNMYNIPAIIDDGLIIVDDKVVGGKSAKLEETSFGAVKCAILDDDGHAEQIKKIIQDLNLKKILILSTSKKMLNIIIKRLELPPLHKLINIEDISSQYEIDIAKYYRFRRGHHVIPVPLHEAERSFKNIILRSIQVFTGRKFMKKIMKQKVVMRPEYHKISDAIRMSSNAVSEFIKFYLKEKYPNVSITNIELHNRENGLEICIYIDIKYVSSLPIFLLSKKIQLEIRKKIEEALGIFIESIDVIIQSIY